MLILKHLKHSNMFRSLFRSSSGSRTFLVKVTEFKIKHLKGQLW